MAYKMVGMRYKMQQEVQWNMKWGHNNKWLENRQGNENGRFIQVSRREE